MKATKPPAGERLTWFRPVYGMVIALVMMGVSPMVIARATTRAWLDFGAGVGLAGAALLVFWFAYVLGLVHGKENALREISRQ
jgi:hypothetical protein